MNSETLFCLCIVNLRKKIPPNWFFREGGLYVDVTYGVAFGAERF